MNDYLPSIIGVFVEWWIDCYETNPEKPSSLSFEN